MPGKVTTIGNIKGLSEADIPVLQQTHGKNSFQSEKPRKLLHILADIIREPMFILLMIACVIYFILGQSTEGIMMLAAICFVATISLYQDVRSTRARQAADLIITDDDPEKLVEAIRQGRKIFSNLKKAIRYIISIHIPIILTASVPLLLGWKYPNIFTPVHVIFLELIMGPTCSIFFEREPVEEQLMLRPPRKRSGSLFQQDELLISIVQGLLITTGVLWLYYFSMYYLGNTLNETRTMVFTTLILSNIFLTFTNRSFTENITRTIHYKNNLAPWIILISVAFLAVIHLVPVVREIFGLAPVPVTGFLLCLGVALVSVAWFEMYKTHPYIPGKPLIKHKP